jgi:hypothetical protein
MANRYWVGGSGTWGTTTTNWSATSGGSSGASAPTSADDVFFDQAGTYTVTLKDQGINCRNLTVSNGTVSIVGTDSGSSWTVFHIYGSVSLIAGTSWNFTHAATSMTVNFNGTSNQTIMTNGTVLNGFHYFNGVGGTWQLQDALTFGPSTYGVYSVNGTVDLNGNTLSTPFFASSGTTAKGFAFNGGNIAVTVGSGTPWNFSSTNLTITGTPVVNYTAATASARTITPGAATESQAINFYITAGTGSITLTAGSYGTIDFTGSSGSLAAIPAVTMYGGLVISTGMSVTGSTNTMTFSSTSGTKTITTNGKTLDFPITFNGVGGTWQLADSLTMGSSRTLTHTNGTLDLNGNTLTVGTAYTTAAGTKNLIFNGGVLVCPAATTTAFNNAVPTGFSTTAGTGTGTISLTAATAKTFVGGSATYNCNLSNSGAALTIAGNNTFRSLASSTSAVTYTFTAGTTTTFTALGFTGAAANLITLGSSSTATYTISQSSGTVSCDYLSVSRSVATGGASFYAGANSTNGGTNTGWSFTAAPAVGTSLNNFFFMF